VQVKRAALKPAAPSPKAPLCGAFQGFNNRRWLKVVSAGWVVG